MPGNSTGTTTTHASVLAAGGGRYNITAIPDPSLTIPPIQVASKSNMSSQHGVSSANITQGDMFHDFIDPSDEAETRDFLRRIFSPGTPLISLNGRPLPVGSWLNDPQGVLTEGLGALEQRYRDEPSLSPAELEQDLQAMGIIPTTDSVMTESNATTQELEAVQGLLKLATDPNGAHVGQIVDGPTGSDCDNGEFTGECEDPKDDDYVESPPKKDRAVKTKD